MNPYQVMGIIACCTLVFAGVVAFLAMQGVHILQALAGVYLLVVLAMLAMQRTARESYENVPRRRLRRSERKSQQMHAHASNFHSLQPGDSVIPE